MKSYYEEKQNKAALATPTPPGGGGDPEPEDAEIPTYEQAAGSAASFYHPSDGVVNPSPPPAAALASPRVVNPQASPQAQAEDPRPHWVAHPPQPRARGSQEPAVSTTPPRNLPRARAPHDGYNGENPPLLRDHGTEGSVFGTSILFGFDL